MRLAILRRCSIVPRASSAFWLARTYDRPKSRMSHDRVRSDVKMFFSAEVDGFDTEYGSTSVMLREPA